MNFGISTDFTKVIQHCKQNQVFLDESEKALPKKK